jgi:hypothetical protein
MAALMSLVLAQLAQLEDGFRDFAERDASRIERLGGAKG